MQQAISLIIAGLLIAGLVWVFRRVSKADGGGITIKKTPRKQLFESVEVKYHSQDYSSVVDMLNGVEITDPFVLLKYADSTFRTGDIEKGRALFRKCFTLQGINKEYVAQNFAKAEFSVGQYRECLKLLEEISPDSQDADLKYGDEYELIRLRAWSLHHIGKHKVAIEVLKKAPLQKKSINHALNDIFLLLAVCYSEIYDNKNAEKFYNKSLAFKYDPMIAEKIHLLQYPKKKD